MKLTGKHFARRPWDSGDNGLIRHFDGIHLTDPGERGFYLAMHTTQDFLKKNNVSCDPTDGYYWDGLILENFTVTGVSKGEGVYVTDGKINSHKPSLAIKNGDIVGLTNGAKAVVLDHLSLSMLTVESLKTDGVIHLQQTDADLLIVRDCVGLTFTCDQSKITEIELWHCSKVDVSALGIKPTIYDVPVAKENIVGSFAINIVDDGVVYGLDVQRAMLKPRKPK